MKAILRATYQHAKNLACFTFLYKFLVNSLAKMNGQQSSAYGGQKTPWHVIGAAAFAGFLVFGTNNPINTQVDIINLFRVLVFYVLVCLQLCWFSLLHNVSCPLILC